MSDRKGLSRRMSDKHEADFAERFGGRVSPGSGNQWHRPMDVRQSRYEVEHPIAMEGKSTLSASNTVTLQMWAKAVEQAGHEEPVLALRWYKGDRLDVALDLAVITWDHLEELLDAARAKYDDSGRRAD